MLFFVTSFGMRYTPRSEALPVQSIDEDEEGIDHAESQKLRTHMRKAAASCAESAALMTEHLRDGYSSCNVFS